MISTLKLFILDKEDNIDGDNSENDNVFIKESKIYIEFIKEIKENDMEERIIKIYTYEGFIYRRLNWILREKKECSTHLNIFLVLLIGSISRRGETTSKNFIKEKNLLLQDENKKSRKYLKFYKGSYLDDKTLENYIDIISKKSKNFIFYYYRKVCK